MPWTPHDLPFIVEKAHTGYVELAEGFQAAIDARDDALDDAVVAVRGIGGSRLGARVGSLGSLFLFSRIRRGRGVRRLTIGLVRRCGARVSQNRNDPADWRISTTAYLSEFSTRRVSTFLAPR